MTDSYGDLVAAALHADAGAARAEMRAAGITCPSCGVNVADLPEGHALVMPHKEPYTARCGTGATVTLAAWRAPTGDEAFDAWCNAANVALYDDFRRREAEALKRTIGTGPANFTGLLDVLNGKVPGP